MFLAPTGQDHLPRVRRTKQGVIAEITQRTQSCLSQTFPGIAAPFVKAQLLSHRAVPLGVRLRVPVGTQRGLVLARLFTVVFIKHRERAEALAGAPSSS